MYFITVGLRNLSVTTNLSTIPANYIPIESVDIPKVNINRYLFIIINI